MSSAQNTHGGQEATLLSLYKTIMHWGSIIVAPGYTDKSLFEAGGNPYGLSVTAGTELGDKEKTALTHQVKRTVQMAEKLRS